MESFVPEVDETRATGEPPADYVRRLAEAKARAAMPGSPPAACIVAADTAVVDGMDVLGKPGDPAEAARMLRRLRGRTHQVYTGIAIMLGANAPMHSEVCVTQVPMRDYSEAEISAYVASGDPMDKAGAYGIQHAGFHPVLQLHGCFASVMGLPLCHLVRMLRRAQGGAQLDLPDRCQAHLNYACPVSSAILRGEMVG